MAVDPRQERVNNLIENGMDNWGRSGKQVTYNIWKYAQIKAAEETAEFYVRNMLTVPFISNKRRLRRLALQQCTFEGLNLEFGVASGKSINLMASQFPERQFYGFDGFGGLPEAWRSDFQKGHFAQPVPEVRENVELVAGWFNETLAGFVAEHDGPVAFLHVDCDLYSSTKTIFDELRDRIVPGTIIVFDEYFNYPGWQQHEHKAWTEFIRQHNVKFEILGVVPNGEQLALKVTAIDPRPLSKKATDSVQQQSEANTLPGLLAKTESSTSLDDLKAVVRELVKLAVRDNEDIWNGNFG